MDPRDPEISIIQELIELAEEMEKEVVDLCDDEKSYPPDFPQDKLEVETDIDEADFQVLDCWEGDDDVNDNFQSSIEVEQKPLLAHNFSLIKTETGAVKCPKLVSGYDSDDTVIFEDLAHNDDSRDGITETENFTKVTDLKDPVVVGRGKKREESDNRKLSSKSRSKERNDSSLKRSSAVVRRSSVTEGHSLSNKAYSSSNKETKNGHTFKPKEVKGQPKSAKTRNSSSERNPRVPREGVKSNAGTEKLEEHRKIDIKPDPDVTVRGTTEKKVDSFLKEMALHHPHVKGLPGLDLSDLPPGVDMDQVQNDTSTSSLHLTDKILKLQESMKNEWDATVRVPWEGPLENCDSGMKPHRIDGRLYADYSKILPNENEVHTKSPPSRLHDWEVDNTYLKTRPLRHLLTCSPSSRGRHMHQVHSKARSKSPKGKRLSRSPNFRSRDLSPVPRVHRKSPLPRAGRLSRSPFSRARHSSRSLSPRGRHPHKSRSPSHGRHHSSAFRRRSSDIVNHGSHSPDERIHFRKSPTKESSLLRALSRSLSRSLSRERLLHRSRSRSRGGTKHSSRSRYQRSQSPNPRQRKYGQSGSKSRSPPTRKFSRSRSRSPHRYRTRRKRSASMENHKTKRAKQSRNRSHSRSHSRGRSPWRPPIEKKQEEWLHVDKTVNGIPLLEEVKLEHDMERFIATNMAATGLLRPSITNWCEQERAVVQAEVEKPMPLPPPPPHITELLKSEEQERQAIEAINKQHEPVSLSSLLESAVTGGVDPNIIDRCQDAIAKLQDVRIKQGRFIVMPNVDGNLVKSQMFESVKFQPWQSTLHRSISNKIQFTFSKPPSTIVHNQDQPNSEPPTDPVEGPSACAAPPFAMPITAPPESVLHQIGQSEAFFSSLSQIVSGQAALSSNNPAHAVQTSLNQAPQITLHSETAVHDTSLKSEATFSAAGPLVGPSISSSAQAVTKIQHASLTEKVAMLTKELSDLRKMLDSKSVPKKNATTQTIGFPFVCITCQATESSVKQALLPTPYSGPAVVQDFSSQQAPKPVSSSRPISPLNHPPACKPAGTPKPTTVPKSILKSSSSVSLQAAQTSSMISSQQNSTQNTTLDDAKGPALVSPHSVGQPSAGSAMFKSQPFISAPPMLRTTADRRSLNKPKPVLKKRKVIGQAEPLDYALNSHQMCGDELLMNLMEYAGLPVNGGNNLCTNNLSIDMVLKRYTSEGHPIGEQIIVFLGLSDMLRLPNHPIFRKKYGQLVGFLRKRCYHLVLIEPPPFPRLSHSGGYWKATKALAEMLQVVQCHSVSVVWTLRLFSKTLNTIDTSYYKDDLLLNAKGLQVLITEIRRVLFEAKKRMAGMDSADDAPDNDTTVDQT